MNICNPAFANPRKYQHVDFILILAPKIHNRNVKIWQKLILKYDMEANTRHIDVSIRRSHFKEARV